MASTAVCFAGLRLGLGLVGHTMSSRTPMLSCRLLLRESLPFLPFLPSGSGGQYYHPDSPEVLIDLDLTHLRLVATREQVSSRTWPMISSRTPTVEALPGMRS
jgi:hypothetical protein